uniref:THAP-type domain-containing protein n=1 Tax=Anopheles atroparvus TaxID=41427 RepID=A0AAG5CXX1_ANOAO
MPASCVIPDCNLKYTHSEDVSFHKFPLKYPDLLKQWIEFTGRDEIWFPTKWSAICSRHFVPSDFKDCAFRKMLLPTAVPSIRKVEEKGSCLVDQPLAAACAPVFTEEIPFRDEDYLRDEHDGTSVTHFPTACVPEHIEDDVQDEEIQLTEITCRICGVSFSRAANNLLFDLAQAIAVVAKYLPFVNLELPDLPRKICLNCLKMVNGFAKFCDNVLRAQTDLEHRFVRSSVVDSSTPTSAPMASRPQPEGVASKPMNIKQEPLTMLHIKEEKIESAIGGNRQKENGLSEPFENSPIIIKNQSIGGDPNSIILFNVGNDRSITPSVVKQQQFRESSKNCEILEIVNLYPPIVDITSATIREVQPCEITVPPAIPAVSTEPLPSSVQQPTISTQFMSGLKVEKMTEQESEQDDYYLPDTLTLINTLEEHSYTKLPIQADDNKDDVFHAVSETNSCTGSVTALEEQKSETLNGFSMMCTDCERNCSSRRRLLCHRALECPARRKMAVCCQFCRQKFPTWARSRAHVALCLKRAAKQKRVVLKPLLDRSKQSIPLEASEGEKLSSQDEVVITRYTCSMCDRSYANPSNLRRHLVTHRPQEQWNHKCGVCYRIFDKLFDLKRHLQISSCASTGQLLAGHELAPSLEHQFPPEQSGGVEFSDSIISSALVISTTKLATDRLLYVCPTCNKHFRSYNNLKVHEPIHTGMKAYICETCGKRFSGRTNLWQHRLTHSELRQFRCKLCPKVFKRRGGLTQHVRAFHMKIKPYRCTTCGYEYALKADMTRCRHSKLRDVESG